MSDKQYQRAYYVANKDRWAERAKGWITKGKCPNHVDQPLVPGRRRCATCLVASLEGRLRRLYGLDRAGWENLVVGQTGRDPITAEELTVPHVDHCADCGAVRALLNENTNRQLGVYFHSSVAFQALAFDLERRPHLAVDVDLPINTPERARAAATYLEAHHQVCPATRPQ